MECRVEREALADALAACAKIAATKSTLPILSNVLIEADEDEIWLTTTDMDHIARITLDGEVAEPGALTLPAKLLADLTAKMTAETVTLLLTGARCRILCGETRANLTWMPADEFPTMPAIALPEFHVPAQALAAMTKATAFCVSKEESRPIMNGICWEIGSDELRMTATNGHRLATRSVRVTGTTPYTREILVHPKPLLAMLEMIGPAGDVGVGCTDTHTWLQTPNVQLGLRLIEGPYPEWRGIIPKKSNRSAGLSTKHLLAAVERIVLVAGSEQHRLRLHFNAGLTIQAETPDMGDADETVPAQFEGKPITIGVNGGYLRELLKVVGSDGIRLRMNAPERAIIIEPDNGDQFLALLMPLRLLDDEAEANAKAAD